jgi:hypothetical protein
MSTNKQHISLSDTPQLMICLASLVPSDTPQLMNKGLTKLDKQTPVN